MAKPDDYVFYALECSRWAQQSKEFQVRQALEEMAKAWTQLALSAGRGVRPEEMEAPRRSIKASEHFCTDWRFPLTQAS